MHLSNHTNSEYHFWVLFASVLLSLFVRSYEPGTLRMSNHTNAEHFLGFCLRIIRQAGPPQPVDCLAPMGNKLKVSFPRTQRRIANSRVEPVVSSISITNRCSTTELGHHIKQTDCSDPMEISVMCLS